MALGIGMRCLSYYVKLYLNAGYNVGITLNRGPCCQMKKINFPRAGELHRRASWQAALQDGPVGCTLSLAAEKGGLEGCPFRQPALLSSVQSAENSCFSFGNSLPTLQLVSLQPADPPISVIRMFAAFSQTITKDNICPQILIFVPNKE